jgi:hypothetical protein
VSPAIFFKQTVNKKFVLCSEPLQLNNQKKPVWLTDQTKKNSQEYISEEERKCV